MAPESNKQHPYFPTVTDMKLIPIVALLAAPFVVSATRVTWDPTYSNGEQSLATLACSDGPNGFLNQGYKVLKDLRTFPNIG